MFSSRPPAALTQVKTAVACRVRLVQDRDELANRVDVFFNVSDDQRVAASIDFNAATARKTSRDDWQQSLIATSAG